MSPKIRLVMFPCALLGCAVVGPVEPESIEAHAISIPVDGRPEMAVSIGPTFLMYPLTIEVRPNSDTALVALAGETVGDSVSARFGVRFLVVDAVKDDLEAFDLEGPVLTPGKPRRIQLRLASESEPWESTDGEATLDIDWDNLEADFSFDATFDTHGAVSGSVSGVPVVFKCLEPSQTWTATTSGAVFEVDEDLSTSFCANHPLRPDL